MSKGATDLSLSFLPYFKLELSLVEQLKNFQLTHNPNFIDFVA